MKIFLLSGGKSPEYDVSLKSAKVIKNSLLRLGHEVEEAVIPRDGKVPSSLFNTSADLIYPVMHGREGEDGSIQGLADCLGLPCASERVLTSAIGMNKHIQLLLFEKAGIPTVPTIAVKKGESYDLSALKGEEFIVKMNSGGSSIGVYRTKLDGIDEALKKVFKLDEFALIQPYVTPLRELECLAVKDNRNGKTSILGPLEVLSSSPYYIYENKYSDDVSVVTGDAVKVRKEIKEKIRALSLQAFEAIQGSLYMRIDFFLSGDEIFINEINTIPGSTEHSHFNILAVEAGGLDAVVETIVQSALARDSHG